MAEFTGFSADTTKFLADLRRNNDKAWFDRNRARYDEHWVGPAKVFVEAAGEALLSISPTVRAEPRVNGSIFRINRDTRFSKDKTPYKDHLDFWFWDDCERNQAVTGFFLRITPDQVGIGVGAHGFGPEQLARFRELVAADRSGKELARVVGGITKAGFPVKGEHYKRPPRGFDEPADPDRARFLRFNALWTGQDLDQPQTLSQRRFVSWCMTRWQKQAPLHEWLRDNLQ